MVLCDCDLDTGMTVMNKATIFFDVQFAFILLHIDIMEILQVRNLLRCIVFFAAVHSVLLDDSVSRNVGLLSSLLL